MRSGGIMGIAMRGDVDTDSLATEVATPAEEALQSLADGRVAAAPGHPDGFHYELTVSGDGAPRVAALDEAEVPAALRPVIEAALARRPPVTP